MPKTSHYFNDYLSIAVLFLMVVALVTGQANASAANASAANASAANASAANANSANDTPSVTATTVASDPANIRFAGNLGDRALKVSINIVTELSHFRGEDE